MQRTLAAPVVAQAPGKVAEKVTVPAAPARVAPQEIAHHRLTAAGALITLGIIYGDIGTSPLYVMKAIIGDNPIDVNVVLGAVSCVFWTLTVQTTIKYVVLTLRADNNGEGGIFSLYALVRRTRKWLIAVAIVGG